MSARETPVCVRACNDRRSHPRHRKRNRFFHFSWSYRLALTHEDVNSADVAAAKNKDESIECYGRRNDASRMLESRTFRVARRRKPRIAKINEENKKKGMKKGATIDYLRSSESLAPANHTEQVQVTDNINYNSARYDCDINS